MFYITLILIAFAAGAGAEYLIATNNPNLVTDIDAFVKKADTEVIAKLKARLLR